MDGYEKIVQAQGGFEIDKFYNKNYKDMNHKNSDSKKV